MDLDAVLRLVERARAGRALTLVGIGGHGASGKSTLASLIPDAQVVSTDGFWDGSGFAIDRVRSEVIDPLLTGREARFTAWDWAAQRPGGVRSIAPTGVVVVEGVCALHRTLRDAYEVRLWVDAPVELRLERGVARDGEQARSTWRDLWIPREERYVERDRPIECAHLVVDGSGTLPST